MREVEEHGHVSDEDTSSAVTRISPFSRDEAVGSKASAATVRLVEGARRTPFDLRGQHGVAESFVITAAGTSSWVSSVPDRERDALGRGAVP
jgi:hypothetical protein